jgi:ATP-binding cassette, subfamily C, bacterial CydCD
MTRSTGSPRPLRQVWRWLRLENGLTTRLAFATLLGIGAAASATGLLLTAAWLIARAAQHPPVLYLMVAIVAVRAFGIARGVLRYAERLVAHDAAFRLLTAVRVAVYQRAERLGPTALADHRRGDLVRRLVGDVDAVQDLLVRALLPRVVTAVLSGGVTLLVVTILPAAGVGLAAAVLGVLVIVPLLVRVTGRAAERSIAPAHGQLAAEVSDAVLSAPDLVAYGAAGGAVDRFNEVAESLRDAERRSAWGSGLAQAVVLLFIGAAVCVAAAAGVVAVAREALDPVLLPLVVLAPLGLHEVLAAIPEAARQHDRAASAVTRVTELLSQPIPVVEPSHPAELPSQRTVVVARDLTTGWTPDRPVLHNLRLDLPAGARFGVVGASGSGKSTLAAALLRFVPVPQGQLFVDGLDVTELSSGDVRGRVGLLDQQAHVFDTTIRENLRIGRTDADDDAMWLALEQARLAAFVLGLPGRLDTAVGEFGRELSGGERQRLALARLLLAHHDVLILDEPTEHLDHNMATALTDDLLELAPARTLVLMTHSEHGLDRLDELIVLADGRIADRGSYADLRARPGPFREVFQPFAGALGPGAPTIGRSQRPASQRRPPWEG